MFSSKRLMAVLAAGILLGAGLVVSDNAQARYYDPETRTWVDGDRVKRKPLQRKVRAKFKRRNVMLKTNQAPGTVIIHTDKKFLYLITGKNKAIRYGVGVGREGFGWNGEVSIRRKAEWPTWIPPKEMVERERADGRELPARMEGGPDNPLGARALYLYKGGRDTLYRIHGTNQPWSIGMNMSSGCIRMMNKDVEHLYNKVDIGTKVIVIGPGKSEKPYISVPTNPLAALFGGAG